MSGNNNEDLNRDLSLGIDKKLTYLGFTYDSRLYR